MGGGKFTRTFAGSLVLVFAAAGAYGQATSPGVAGSYVPITAKERWNTYLKENYASPLPYLRALASGSIQQLTDSPPEWHQGAQAYFKRSGSSFAQYAIDDTIRVSLAAAAGYDPRYQRCSCEGAKRRILHAVKWTFLTRNNEGKTRFDWPRFAGDYGGAFVANAWYPERYGPKDALRSGHQQAAYEFGGSLLKEFTPEIKRLLHRK